MTSARLSGSSDASGSTIGSSSRRRSPIPRYGLLALGDARLVALQQEGGFGLTCFEQALGDLGHGIAQQHAFVAAFLRLLLDARPAR